MVTSLNLVSHFQSINLSLITHGSPKSISDLNSFSIALTTAFFVCDN